MVGIASCSRSIDPNGYREAIVLLEWPVAVRYKPVISDKPFSPVINGDSDE